MFAAKNLTIEEAEVTCKRYFIGGFFFLPFLWLLNYFFFRNYSDKSDYISITAKRSLILACIFGTIWLIWFILALFFMPSSPLWVINPSGEKHKDGFIDALIKSVQ